MARPGEASVPKLLEKDLAVLMRLQAADAEIKEHEDVLSRLPQELVKRKASFEKVQKIAGEAKSLLQNALKMIDAKNVESKAIQEELKKLENRQSNLKTDNEFKANQSQINDRKQKNQRLQDEVLDLMVALDELRPRDKKAADDLKSADDEYRRAKEAMSQTISRCETGIKSARERRAAIIPEVDASLLELYETIRRRTGAIGLAEVVNDICTGCDTAIMPQRVSDLISGNRVQCPNCERILYIKRA